MTLTYSSNGSHRTIFSLLAGVKNMSLSEFKGIKFPLRMTINNPDDYNKLTSALPTIIDSIGLLSERFNMICSYPDDERKACFVDISDVNYASVSRGTEQLKNIESVKRGTPYSSVAMPDWDISWIGSAADDLYDALNVDGGPYEHKQVDLSPSIKLGCDKRPGASDPYTFCFLGIEDSSREFFHFPEILGFDYDNTASVFSSEFSYDSEFKGVSIRCAANQCHFHVQYPEL